MSGGDGIPDCGCRNTAHDPTCPLGGGVRVVYVTPWPLGFEGQPPVPPDFAHPIHPSDSAAIRRVLSVNTPDAVLPANGGADFWDTAHNAPVGIPATLPPLVELEREIAEERAEIARLRRRLAEAGVGEFVHTTGCGHPSCPYSPLPVAETARLLDLEHAFLHGAYAAYYGREAWSKEREAHEWEAWKGEQK